MAILSSLPGPPIHPGYKQLLAILRSTATELLQRASLRDLTEIEETCQQVVLVRSLLQEARVNGPAREIVRRVNLKRLADVGGAPTANAAKGAAAIVAAMTAAERIESAGLYFVRDHAAMWMLGNLTSYFSGK